jgi:hypothetical protein
MAAIFISYRRSDSPQACRIYDWLAHRLGKDIIFLDVANIPSATHFNENIKTELLKCKIVLALVGPNWLERIHRDNDIVRMEIQTALDAKIPIFPLVCSNTTMPSGDNLPSSIAEFAYQNSRIVSVSLPLRFLYPIYT